MYDALGDRMKERYEGRSQTYLPRRSYCIIRVDGKAFHTFTRDMVKPFDMDMMNAMDKVALALCQELQGAVLAYTQSDEVSVLLTDFALATTDAWFDYNVQKMVSISASIATRTFNRVLEGHTTKERNALFDSRAFVIPDKVEVANYFIWRYKDWLRNSVQMLARSHFSHKQLNGKSCEEMHEMIHQKGDNWAKLSERAKNGGLCTYYAGSGVWETSPPNKALMTTTALDAHIPVHGYEGVPKPPKKRPR